jgi:hypothetical protein
MLEHRLLIYAPLFIYRQMGESTGVIPNSPQQVGYRGPPPGAPPSAERSQQPRSGTAIRQSLFADPPGSPSDSDEASRLADSLSDFSLDENGDLYRLKAGIHSKIEWTTTNSWCTEIYYRLRSFPTANFTSNRLAIVRRHSIRTRRYQTHSYAAKRHENL